MLVFRPRCLITCMLIAALFGHPHTADAARIDHEDDVQFLLEGVQHINSGGIPGPLCVFGEDAFPVVTANDHQAVVAAAEAGRGRIVAFGHGGFLGNAEVDTTRLLVNAVRWCGQLDRRRSREPLRIFNTPDRVSASLSQGTTPFEDIRGGNWREALGNVDVMFFDGHRKISEEDRGALQQAIRRGMSVITSGLGWGWLQLNSGKTLADHPGSLLLEPFGIGWADGYLGPPSGGYNAGDGPSRWAHIPTAFAQFEQGDDLPENERASAIRSIAFGLRAMPRESRSALHMRRQIERLVARNREEIDAAFTNMVTQPISAQANPLARLAIELYEIDERHLPPRQVKAHPSAAAFPGSVPDDARRVTERVRVDTSQLGWHSTGLYAAPGELITINVDADVAALDLTIQIGAHQDKQNFDAKVRLPTILRRFPIDDTRVLAANAVGGPIYIDVPNDAPQRSVTVRIHNAVRAPLYQLGKTPIDAWLDEIRQHPAPWAEIGSDKIIFTVPSKDVRNLDNPDELMRFWDSVVDACFELEPRQIHGMGDRPLRYVPDHKLSVGYMYFAHHRPIATHMDITATMMDLDTLSRGERVWGLFHEMGHSHQRSDWTFGGTGEVTVNLFTLYAIERACGLDAQQARDFTDESALQIMKDHAANGARFSIWKRQPFLALQMYFQLQRAFGWDAYKNVFAEYRALKQSERPKNDDEKRDQWLIRMSRTVGHDLGPFFDAWGVPVSDQARREVARLPEWMPDGWED